jgi:cyclopropane fatty-acyl-phospholipid synthase-like methyltransferase
MRWAASLIAARPGERVLEVGPGHGVLMGLLLADGAVVTGLDRSATMTAAARKLHGDRATVITGRLQDADPGTGPYDVVVAMRVREVWTDPRSLPAVRRLLAPHGRIVLVLDSPSGPVAPETVDAVVSALAANDFHRVDVRTEGSLTGVVASAQAVD